MSNFKVDMVINPSCKVKENDYIAKDVLCGMEYVILSHEYSIGRLDKIDLVQNSILVTMGGIDHYNISSRVIPIIEEITTNIEVNILIGPYYENVQLIKNAVKNSTLKINLLEDISNISSAILENSMALTAGGFTVYEMAAMSTPCIGIALWDNQLNNIDCLSYKCALIPLYYLSNSEFDKHLKEELSRLINNTKLRLEMSKSARGVVDGNGADRISKVITQKYSTKFNYNLQ
jgi:spore coat polysaccharide biosynthesis predicted glycosyltransferase SpsG